MFSLQAVSCVLGKHLRAVSLIRTPVGGDRTCLRPPLHVCVCVCACVCVCVEEGEEQQIENGDRCSADGVRNGDCIIISVLSLSLSRWFPLLVLVDVTVGFAGCIYCSIFFPSSRPKYDIR